MRQHACYPGRPCPPVALASRAETALRVVDDDLGSGLCDPID
ncbi:hypothetical protein ACFHYQ_28285 [Sphaerimonospora cavernae]|uniref:Uncharacterized protein n=1 Tax=Sphaerimonospora cavernae TaxID=1740611 RepID=A0ABV6UDE9_9ACTN